MNAKPLLSLNLVTGCLRPKIGLMLKCFWIIAVVTLFSNPDTKIPLENSFFFYYCSLRSPPPRGPALNMLLGKPGERRFMPPTGILII